MASGYDKSVAVREFVIAHVDEFAVGFVFGVKKDEAVPNYNEGADQKEGEGPADDAAEGGKDEHGGREKTEDRDDPAKGIDVVKDDADRGFTVRVRDGGILREDWSLH